MHLCGSTASRAARFCSRSSRRMSAIACASSASRTAFLCLVINLDVRRNFRRVGRHREVK